MILCAFISVTLYYNYIYKVILFCNTTYFILKKNSSLVLALQFLLAFFPSRMTF